MKKIALIVSIICLSTSLLFAGKKMPAEVKVLQSKVMKITKTYYKSMVRAKTAKQLARAINNYASSFEKLVPKLKAMKKKYPETSSDSGNAGDYDSSEFDKEMSRMMSDKKMQQAFQKHMKFYSDPSVQSAMRRLGQVMGKMGSE